MAIVEEEMIVLEATMLASPVLVDKDRTTEEMVMLAGSLADDRPSLKAGVERTVKDTTERDVEDWRGTSMPAT